MILKTNITSHIILQKVNVLILFLVYSDSSPLHTWCEDNCNLRLLSHWMITQMARAYVATSRKSHTFAGYDSNKAQLYDYYLVTTWCINEWIAMCAGNGSRGHKVMPWVNGHVITDISHRNRQIVLNIMKVTKIMMIMLLMMIVMVIIIIVIVIMTIISIIIIMMTMMMKIILI